MSKLPSQVPVAMSRVGKLAGEVELYVNACLAINHSTCHVRMLGTGTINHTLCRHDAK